MVSLIRSNGGTGQLFRPRYFQGKVVTAADLNAGEKYLVERLRRHNRLLHGCGVACGLDVVPDPDAADPPGVIITPGCALSPQGDEIYVPEPQRFTIRHEEDAGDECAGAEGPAGRLLYLAIRYREEEFRPEPAAGNGCAPTTTCGYSRLRAGFEIACLGELPQGCAEAPPELDLPDDATELLANPLERIPPRSLEDVPPFHDCAPEEAEPWVVLACLDLRADGALTIEYTGRLQLLSTRLLQELYAAHYSSHEHQTEEDS